MSAQDDDRKLDALVERYIGQTGAHRHSGPTTDPKPAKATDEKATPKRELPGILFAGLATDKAERADDPKDADRDPDLHAGARAPASDADADDAVIKRYVSQHF